MKNFYTSLILIMITFFGFAQESIVQNIEFTSIGPSVMSGRVVDLDVNVNNPTEFYVAYASGGLWYTNNNGTTFTPVMDNSPTQNIGDIAVDWEKGTIWVGTGENNSSRSSYAGIGILKSNDKGETWQNIGFADSHHIGRILINPDNANELVVGVIGHLYTPNAERGIFKTTDGGKSWKKTLFINEDTGVIDIVSVPGKPNIMYASAWERERKAWNFKGSGDGSAIYKSINGGDSWKKISDGKNGFPQGNGVGRIGLAAFDENIIYALLDNQDRREKEKKKDDSSGNLEKTDFIKMDKAAFSKLEDKKLDKYLKDNNFPKKYSVKSVKKLIRENKILLSDIASYTENANNDLFDTPVKGAEVYLSEDGGRTWSKTHEKYVDELYFSYGYYFGEIRVHPKNRNKIFILGVPILISNNGGKNFKSISKENVHADHQALWINPNLEGHLIDGNDGGVNISYDDGESWIKNNQPAVGQFYTVNVDNKKNYTVYGGLQDNGVWKGPGNNKESKSWHQTGSYPFKSIMGGDGMQVEIDNRNDSIVYSGYQFGNYFRINTKTNQSKYIQPKHDLGEGAYRFNWQTPILLSKHNQDILYLGSNKLHRSMKRGEDFKVISKDLTKGSKDGNVPFGTLTTISESPFQFGLLYVGSDDGLVHITKNGGGSWTDISFGLPQNLWVSRVIASQHKKERVYVTLNGYRNDDFDSYVFVSDDFGKTWKDIANNLPNSPVNVIKEDPVDEDILYLGNDQGVYVTFDQGVYWDNLKKGIPKVAVHDLVIQKKTKDLVIGTHGRSIYKTNIAYLEKYKEVKDKDLVIFDLDDVQFSKGWGNSWSKWLEPNVPEFEIAYYASKIGSKKIQIKTEDDILVNSWNSKAKKGFNFEDYDLTFSEKGLKTYRKKHKETDVEKKKNDKYYLPKGKYKVVIDGVSKEFKIK
ncbi:MAG: glycosyl hydrolase [Flavobacteriaceae bacterium]|nr:glycosyl hydrolase [Flavobacteriaceae bacterium]